MIANKGVRALVSTLWQLLRELISDKDDDGSCLFVAPEAPEVDSIKTARRKGRSWCSAVQESPHIQASWLLKVKERLCTAASELY